MVTEAPVVAPVRYAERAAEELEGLWRERGEITGNRDNRGGWKDLRTEDVFILQYSHTSLGVIFSFLI